MTTSTTLGFPMFAMALLTLAVLVKLFTRRLQFAREGEIDLSYFKTYQLGDEPEASAKLARNFMNLFEAPTLFYAVCLLAMVTGTPGVLMNVLAWLYVVFRVAHTVVHGGTNKLKPRIAAYFGSWVVLVVIWGVWCVSTLRA